MTASANTLTLLYPLAPVAGFVANQSD